MKSVATGLIAIILLVMYGYLVYQATGIVQCANESGCTYYVLSDFNDVKAQAMSVLGGLVSALIISVLAITPKGEALGAKALGPNPSRKARNILKWVTGLYILGWILIGVYALLVGLNHPDTLPQLTAVGQSWFGLAVASVYAYFGINP